MFEKFLWSIAGRALAGVKLRRIWRWFKTPAVMIAGGTHFSVVMADLADDVELKQTGHVARILGGQKGIKVLRNGQVLRIEEFGDQAENLIAAEKRGQQWLEQHDADVLVWGEVAGVDQVLRLRFLSRTGRIGSDTKGYPLTGTLELPTEFHLDFGQVLYMTALSAVGHATEMEGHYLVDLLRPAAQKVERFLQHPPPGLAQEPLAHVHVAYGIAAGVMGEQSGDSVYLARAESSFHAALEIYSRDRVPLRWAMTQNNLGNTLAILGELEGGTARLKEAVAAYRAALEVYTRDRLPLDWAMTQYNLGAALQSLGEREGGTARLKEAVAACRAALEVRTRDRVPLDWAATQNNLGAALSSLGEREEGTGQLEEAVRVYRSALEVYTRDRLPLLWAMTQNNLGAALSSLGEREDGTARQEEAVEVFRDALEVYTSDRVPLSWVMTQYNLGIALRILGDREEGAARLEEAVEVFRDALEVYTLDRLPQDWATTQYNLGIALRILGEREGGTARLAEAVTAFRAAQEVYEAPEGADYYVSGTKENLAQAQKILDERRQN